MANYPINPYGQNEEMPEGYPIADNLRTDSAQQALSAKQGKKLGDFISTDAPVNTSLIGEVVGFLLGADPTDPTWSNVWAANTNYKGKLVPVQSGRTYKITAVNGTTYYAVLQDDVLVSGQTPNYVAGTTERSSLESGETDVITIPADGNYLYIYTKYQETNKEPDIFIVFNVDNSTLGEIIHDVAGDSSLPIAKLEIVVAASNAPEWQKVNADYQCTGTNDELVIQQAVNAVAANKGGTIKLSSGLFHIGSFPNSQSEKDLNGNSITTYTAIMLPDADTGAKGYEIRLIGDVMPYSNKDQGGTRFVVDDECYVALNDSTHYRIFSAPWYDDIMGNARISVFMMNFRIWLPWNQKKIMCIDCRNFNKVYIQFVECTGYLSGERTVNGVTFGRAVDYYHPVDKAVEGCVGLRMTGGSNFGLINDYRNINCSGFYEGFQVGGEHALCVHFGASYNVYAYTFGHYYYRHTFSHQIVMINCGDELNVNLPLFYSNGNNMNNAGQGITIIDFELERVASCTPGGVLGDLMKEQVPGSFCGEVSYHIMDWTKTDYNCRDKALWEEGSGINFVSVNRAHRLMCNSTERRSYAPNYLQQVYDTSLGKMVWCINPSNKTWIDGEGNNVDE